MPYRNYSISDPCETLVTHINQLGNFTHHTSEASWTTRGVWPMEIAIEFLISPLPSWNEAEENDLPLPTHTLTHWSGGRGCNQGVGEQGGHLREKREQTVLLRSLQKRMWMSRDVPDAWQYWLYKPSRQETAVSVVHRYSVTGRLLWRSLTQPSVPLAGILYEKRPHTARSRVAKWNYRRRDPLVCDS